MCEHFSSVYLGGVCCLLVLRPGWANHAARSTVRWDSPRTQRGINGLSCFQHLNALLSQPPRSKCHFSTCAYPLPRHTYTLGSLWIPGQGFFPIQTLTIQLSSPRTQDPGPRSPHPWSLPPSDPVLPPAPSFPRLSKTPSIFLRLQAPKEETHSGISTPFYSLPQTAPQANHTLNKPSLVPHPSAYKSLHYPEMYETQLQ